MSYKTYYARPGDEIHRIVEDMRAEGYPYPRLSISPGVFVVEPVTLFDNLSITFHDSILIAKSGCYPPHSTKPWRRACMFKARGQKNIRMTGKGLLDMKNVEFIAGNTGGHIINLEDCNLNDSGFIYIKGLTLKNAQGDNIFVGTNNPTYNVRISDVRCYNAKRNGISLCDCIDVRLERVLCHNNKASGIDIEPESGGHAQMIKGYDLDCSYNGADGVQIGCGKSTNYYDVYIRRLRANKNIHAPYAVYNYATGTLAGSVVVRVD